MAPMHGKSSLSCSLLPRCCFSIPVPKEEERAGAPKVFDRMPRPSRTTFPAKNKKKRNVVALLARVKRLVRPRSSSADTDKDEEPAVHADKIGNYGTIPRLDTKEAPAGHFLGPVTDLVGSVHTDKIDNDESMIPHIDTNEAPAGRFLSLVVDKGHSFVCRHQVVDLAAKMGTDLDEHLRTNKDECGISRLDNKVDALVLLAGNEDAHINKINTTPHNLVIDRGHQVLELAAKRDTNLDECPCTNKDECGIACLDNKEEPLVLLASDEDPLIDKHTFAAPHLGSNKINTSPCSLVTDQAHQVLELASKIDMGMDLVQSDTVLRDSEDKEGNTAGSEETSHLDQGLASVRRRRAASGSRKVHQKSWDFSTSLSSFRRASPRTRLASSQGSRRFTPDHASKCLGFVDKENKSPSTSCAASRRVSARTRGFASESQRALQKAWDFSTSLSSLRRVSPQTRLGFSQGSQGISPDVSKVLGFDDKDKGSPSTSCGASRRVSARTRLLAPGAGGLNNTKFAEKDDGRAQVVSRRLSTTIRRLAFDGVDDDTVQKRMDLVVPPTLSSASQPPTSSGVSKSKNECVSKRKNLPGNSTRPATPPDGGRSASSRGKKSNTPSATLSYIADAKRLRKKIPSHLEDAHQLRLLYNRNLQWRFANAYANQMQSSQKIGAENMLFSVCDENSRMFESLVKKRKDVQRLRQEVKLAMVLKEQMDYLDRWESLEGDHSSALFGATGALKASTLRLPVTGGAKADVTNVKNAVSSAIDLMQALGSSTCHLLPKIEATLPVVTELSAVAAEEMAALKECRELLAIAATLQVQESSLRTQAVQQRKQQDR